MNARSAIYFAATLVAGAIPSLSHAHFLWATLDSSKKSVSVGLQEVPTDDPLPLGDRAAKVVAWSKGKKNLRLIAEGSWLKSASDEVCVGASLDYGVIDRRDQNRGLFWLRYFAKGAASVDAAQSRLGLPFELTAEKGDEGKFLVTALKEGKPIAGAEVVIEDTNGKATFEGKTAPDGTVSVPAVQGLFAVRALVTDDGKGSHDGKAYDLVRTYSTLTIQNGGPATAKPLTWQLHEAFGNDHDVVGRTAFIETLMAGKLTKAQFRHHFQQRALIHEAVDQVLRASDKSLPYGDQQKEVLTLLHKDMEKAGIAWPKESDAWPLTSDLLAEIRKGNPYFALGVLHVYYGGITHGGRDIGKIIEDTLSVEPTYYLKSDGYAAYARAVDGITDPEAQKEMIRGGVAAYRYIIASNDLQVFKAR